MGRVKRYKRLKACDPFSGKRPLEDGDHDLPPALDQEESDALQRLKSGVREDIVQALRKLLSKESRPMAGPTRKRRRQEKRWEQDALRDDEYVDMLLETAKRKRQPEVSIGSRRPNESMKAFRYRVRQESRELMKASAAAHSVSKARRREYLRLKKKAKKQRRSVTAVAADEDDSRECASHATRSVASERQDGPPDLRLVGVSGRGGGASREESTSGDRMKALQLYRLLKARKRSQK